MRELLEMIRWWEPLLIAAAVLAVVYEKRLIVIENRMIARIRRNIRIYERLFRKHARSDEMGMVATPGACGRHPLRSRRGQSTHVCVPYEKEESD